MSEHIQPEFKLWENTYTALQRSSIDIVPVELTNGHGGFFVGIHLYERKAPVRLEPCLDDESKIIEKWDQIILGCVRREIADVAGGLPLRSLLNDCLVAASARRRELVVTVWGRRRHSHCSHGLLLGYGWLAFLVRPVAADRSRAKPFAIHFGKCLFCLVPVAKGHESVATRATGLHIPHDTTLGDITIGLESLRENVVIDFIGKITNENVVVIGRVFFGSRVGLVSVVDANFLSILLASVKCMDSPRGTNMSMDETSVQSSHGTLSHAWIVVLDKTVVESFTLELPKNLH